MYFVYRYVGFTIDIKDTLRTALAAAFMGGVVLLTYEAVMTKTLHNSLVDFDRNCIWRGSLPDVFAADGRNR